jgi:glycosyltransferase involved in cell wall biosynthesis
MWGLRVGFAHAGHAARDASVGVGVTPAERRGGRDGLGRVSVARVPFRFIPWTTDLSAYRAAGVLDVGLCPVVENPWSSSRSDLKILEYAMSGCASVVSDAIPYKDWVDGEFVVKARDARGFLRQTQLLVNDAAERVRLRDGCRDHVLAERTVEANAWRWREAITADAGRR